MSDDNYPRLGWSASVGWYATPDGQQKLVPADAIVIERGDLPEVHVEGERVRAGASSWPRLIAAPKPECLREDALELLAIADYLTAHPPVDEAQVEALTPLVADAIGFTSEGRGGFSPEDLARALVTRGVRVDAPEVKP